MMSFPRVAEGSRSPAHGRCCSRKPGFPGGRGQPAIRLSGDDSRGGAGFRVGDPAAGPSRRSFDGRGGCPGRGGGLRPARCPRPGAGPRRGGARRRPSLRGRLNLSRRKNARNMLWPNPINISERDLHLLLCYFGGSCKTRVTMQTGCLFPEKQCSRDAQKDG